MWTAEEQANFQMALDEFSTLTHCKVTYVSTGNDIATILGTRIQGGNPPDVAIIPQPALVQSLVAQKALIPLSGDIAAMIEANYAPVWKDLGSVNGTLYGLVWKVAQKSCIWYNVADFTQAGIKPPQTWDDLLAAAGTLLNSGVTPFSIAGGDGWTLTDWFENIYLRTAGADMYDKLTKHQIPWTDPSVTTALQTLDQIFSHSDWIIGGNSGALQVTFPQSVTQVFGSPSQGAMVYEADFVETNILSETKAVPGTDAKEFAFPSINGSQPSVVAGGDTAVMMKDNAAAKALIQFLASPDAASILVKQGGFISPNKNVPVADYTDPIVAQLAQDLTAAGIVRFDMSDLMPPAFGGTPAQGEWKYLQDFLANPSNMANIQQQLETAAAAAYGG